MSIASSITGTPSGNEASQVLTLLSVMADPVAYNKKLNDLIEATEANKKSVELVGPASEILQIRKDIEAEKAAVKDELADARKQASTMVSDAHKKARAILADAGQKSDNILAAAKAVQEEVGAALVAAQERSRALDDMATQLTAREKQLNEEARKVEAIREETLAVQKEYHDKAEALQKKISAFANALG